MRFMGVDSHFKGLFTRVTLPLAVFGLINQAARTVMAIIGPVLAVEFRLSASELGLLAACMLGAYAAAQLPGGMALDRVGARNVQAGLGLVTAVGFALFALAEDFATLAVCRRSAGAGCSGCFAPSRPPRRYGSTSACPTSAAAAWTVAARRGRLR
jgi:nitrate/nitrite transporter NarK